jgi:hypothetical protein
MGVRLNPKVFMLFYQRIYWYDFNQAARPDYPVQRLAALRGQQYLRISAQAQAFG